MAAKKREKPNIEISVDEFKNRLKEADMNSMFIFGAIILVLVIGLMAIFSPDSNMARMANPACGKIVVAADGSSLRANIALSLTGAKSFLVIDPINNKLLETVANPFIGRTTSPSEVAYFVAGKGEEAVIAGSIDPGCYRILSQFGIRGFGGYGGKVKDAVDLYRQARISAGPSLPPPGAGMKMRGQAPRAVPAQQAAFFGMGKQGFLCPGCNWRLELPADQQGFPKCPNCGSMMAKKADRFSLDGMGSFWNEWVDPQSSGMEMQHPEWGFGLAAQTRAKKTAQKKTKRRAANENQNNGFGFPGFGMNAQNPMLFGWPQINAPGGEGNNNGFFGGGGEIQNAEWGLHAAAPAAPPMPSSIPPQPNFWQGRDTTGYFICPNCNWRMMARREMGQYPRCPNCRVIMARGGVVHQVGNANTMGVAMAAPVTGNHAPPIYRNAQMRHQYRGVCMNCHQILEGNPPVNQPGATRVAFQQGPCVVR